MTEFIYKKSSKYADLKKIYSQVSGPGGLKLAEFIAEKMNILPEHKLLDIGTNKGYQTCFLAKEYGPFIVGIDPWQDYSSHLTKNAEEWDVAHRVLGIKAGLPDTGFADNSFDRIYCTTMLEMIRGVKGEKGYQQALEEIHRVMKPGAIFGMGEPMHKDAEIPAEIYPYVSVGEFPAPWIDCFTTPEKTAKSFETAGFEILEADYAPDAHLWWQEYARYDADPGDDAIVIEKDNNRWLSFGHVIAKK